MDGHALMHHKFVILDKSTLVTGSFNWCTAAVVSNNENLIISTESKLVALYCGEFEKLWQEYDRRTKDILKLDCFSKDLPH